MRFFFWSPVYCAKVAILTVWVAKGNSQDMTILHASRALSYASSPTTSRLVFSYSLFIYSRHFLSISHEFLASFCQLFFPTVLFYAQGLLILASTAAARGARLRLCPTLGVSTTGFWQQQTDASPCDELVGLALPITTFTLRPVSASGSCVGPESRSLPHYLIVTSCKKEDQDLSCSHPA